MEIALTTNPPNLRRGFTSVGPAILWKAWQDSRGRFFSALVLLASLVVYAVVTSPGFLARYNTRFPDKPLIYSVYVWTGLFHYALQGLWVLAALVVALGGLAREKASGVALFTLGLPVRRLHLFLIRAAMAWAESIVLGLASATLIAVLSPLVGKSYSFFQALAFGALMSAAGLAILAFGLLLSEVFEGEFTAPVIGLCTVTTVFLGYRSHMLRGWNVFDVMSGTAAIDPNTQLLTGAFPWFGLAICLFLSCLLLFATGAVVQARDF
jgi:ABC-type transport system involved in multi-copper enzyme maturation permease subunit